MVFVLISYECDEIFVGSPNLQNRDVGYLTRTQKPRIGSTRVNHRSAIVTAHRSVVVLLLHVSHFSRRIRDTTQPGTPRAEFSALLTRDDYSIQVPALAINGMNGPVRRAAMEWTNRIQNTKHCEGYSNPMVCSYLPNIFLAHIDIHSLASI